ncbi:MAG: hypothetical protein ACYDBB_19285 [Armatimonadota bacterium]
MPTPLVQTGQIPDILQRLDVLQKRDQYVEDQMAACKKAMIPWWIGLVAGIILLIIGGATGLTVLVILAVLGLLVCVPFLIYWGIKLSGWSKENIEDRRLQLPRHFLGILSSDFPKKGKCSVNIDFNGYKVHGQLVEQEKTGGFLSPTIRVFKYSDTWFTAKGKLVDDSIFRVSVEQIIHRKEKQKRKYTKVNERIVEKVTLALRVSPTAYPNWAQLNQTLLQSSPNDPPLNGFQIARAGAQNGTVRVCAVTPMCTSFKGRGGSTQVTGEENLASGDTLLQLFLYVYARLQECRGQQVVNG